MGDLLAHPTPLYVSVLLGGFTSVALWETFRPLRRASVPLGPRWTANFALHFLNQLLLPLLFPVGLVGAALLARERGWGLLNLLALDGLAAILISILAIDLARYLTHRAAHGLAWFWRLHRVHHCDLDYDCTIGLRFHPLESLLTFGIIVLGVLAAGLSPLGVLIIDAATIALGFLAHGNLSLPASLERPLRWLLVTPDMHRIHHSVLPEETRSNFSPVFSFWDRLFGTYRDQAAAGALGMTFGLADARDPSAQGFFRLLWMPFRRQDVVAESGR